MSWRHREKMNKRSAKRLALYIAGNLSSHFCHLPPTLFWKEGLMFRRSDEESEREYTGIQRQTKCVCEREILCVLVTKEKTVDETDQ